MTDNLGQNLLRYTIDSKKFIVFDFETEGLNMYFTRPWSVGWILCEGKNIISRHHKYIWWPDLNISAGAAAKTRFNYEDYKSKAEDPKLVHDEFSSYLYDDDRIRLGHNILGIDVYMENTWRRGIGLPSDYSFVNNRLIDTHSVAKAIKKNIKPTKPLITWMYKMNNLVEKGLRTNLTLLAKEYKIPIVENEMHDALTDVIINWQVFMKQIWDIELEV